MTGRQARQGIRFAAERMRLEIASTFQDCGGSALRLASFAACHACAATAKGTASLQVLPHIVCKLILLKL